MKFNQFYFNEDSVSYIDLSNTFGDPKNISPGIEADRDTMKNIPYDINPSRDNFMKILRHPLSTYNYGPKKFNVVRIGIDKDYNVWIWPGFILHRIAARDISKKPFEYRLHYDAGNPDTFLTDTPQDYLDNMGYQKTNIKELEKLTSVLQKYFGFLGTRGITDWHSRGREETDDQLNVSFKKFGGKQTDKNIDDQEPEYATIIRKFHSEGYQIIKEENLNPDTIKKGKEIANKLGIIFDGVWEIINAYAFTDPHTESSMTAYDYDEAKKKLENMRAEFEKASKKEMNQYYSMI